MNERGGWGTVSRLSGAGIIDADIRPCREQAISQAKAGQLAAVVLLPHADVATWRLDVELAAENRAQFGMKPAVAGKYAITRPAELRAVEMAHQPARLLDQE